LKQQEKLAEDLAKKTVARQHFRVPGGKLQLFESDIYTTPAKSSLFPEIWG